MLAGYRVFLRLALNCLCTKVLDYFLRRYFPYTFSTFKPQVFLWKFIGLITADETPSVTSPEISEEIVTTTEGKYYEITCSAGGVPKPSWHWEKDGKIVKDCQKGFKFCYIVLSGGKAQHPKDSGVFSCVAKNKLGIAQKNLAVVVQG